MLSFAHKSSQQLEWFVEVITHQLLVSLLKTTSLWQAAIWFPPPSSWVSLATICFRQSEPEWCTNKCFTQVLGLDEIPTKTGGFPFRVLWFSLSYIAFFFSQSFVEGVVKWFNMICPEILWHFMKEGVWNRLRLFFLVISMHQAVQCDGSEFLFCIMLISADVDQGSIPIWFSECFL